MAELTLLIKGEKTQSWVSVDKNQMTIGRLPECDLFLPSHSVSRHHARIAKSPEGNWAIEDLGSKNGTRINGVLIATSHPLCDGDVLELGEMKLVVMLETSIATLSAGPIPPLNEDSGARTVISHDVQELQQRWIDARDTDGKTNDPAEAGKDRVIARLKDLVDIAKNLSAAASIEEIFSQVEKVVFRELSSIDRLALLVDVDGTGQLELIDATIRSTAGTALPSDDGRWISQSICKRVFSQKVAIQSADTQADERFLGEKSLVFKGIRSVMAVPLWDETNVIGVLYGDAQLSSYHWAQEGESELSFFSALANIVASSVQRWILWEKWQQGETIRQHLERYHSASVIRQLTSQDRTPDGRLRPAEMEITVLFADVVGFTAISERLTPMDIAHLLNTLFEEMLQEVFHYGGTLDKFLGDGLMAFFGAPEAQSDHADRAVAVAKGMLSRVARLNVEDVWHDPLEIRIALNSGKAVVGDVGSSQRMDYTALGGTINLASRMEQICPPGRCVISEGTYARLSQPSDFTFLSDYSFKGIERRIKVYQSQ